MQGIIHVRIDDRMIHGQVATQWTNQLNASRIMVINDEVANNPTRKSIVRLAAPPNVRTSIITRETALTNIKQGKYAGQRVLLIAVSPIDVKYLLDHGLPITKVNVGNLARRPGTKRVFPSINLTATERQAFKDLIAAGVKVMVVQTPESSVEYMKDFL